MKIQDLRVVFAVQLEGIIHPKEGGMQVAGRALLGKQLKILLFLNINSKIYF